MLALRFATALLIPLAPILLSGGKQLQAADSFTCPVTKPIESPSPAPFSSASGKWFGTDKLWTRIEPGRWGARLHTDLGFKQPKIVWFSSGYDSQQEPHPSLTITGRRLDGPSAPLIFHGANNAFIPGKGSFIPSSVTLPTLGCWEITGHYKGQDVTFVVRIGP
jgi:hypothetical protein